VFFKQEHHNKTDPDLKN